LYAGKYREDKHTTEEAIQLYIDDVKKLIEDAAADGKGVSCFIAESLQSCGGQIILPPGYLRQVYKSVKPFSNRKSFLIGMLFVGSSEMLEEFASRTRFR